MAKCDLVGWQPGTLGASSADHLLVWTLRRVVVRREICAAILREFADACGDESEAVLGIFRAFVLTLGQAARRPVSVGHPGYFGLTADERQILSMIRAAQDDDQVRLDALVCWFARPNEQHPLALAIYVLGTAFAAHDLLVSAAEPVPVVPTAPSPHLHLVH
jgi:hypothetical protein